MIRLTAADGNTYHLVAAREHTADDVPLEFRDERHAFRFLANLAELGSNRISLRSFAAGALFVHDTHGFTENDLWERLAAGLVSGRWLIVQSEGLKRRTSFGGGKGSEGAADDNIDEEEEEPPEEEPPPPTEEKTWVTFAFVDDETGEPVKGVTLKVKLPDGQTKVGKSDASGLIEFKDIPGGSCTIEKMLDTDTLEVVAVE